MGWGRANRPKVSRRVENRPTDRDGFDGDIQIKGTGLGAKLFAKWSNRWWDVPLSIDGVTKIGLTDSDYLSIDRDSVDIYSDSVKVASFGETTTVKDINLTGKISVTSTGTRNICIGSWASGNPDQGDDNIVLGTEAGAALASSSTDNIMIGTNAGLLCTGGTNADFNVIIGTDANSSDTTPDQNVIIGKEAGKHLIESRYNIALGYRAMMAESDGSNARSSYNVAIGVSAMGDCHKTNSAVAWPQGNVAIGHECMRIVSGDDNISIGVQAGDTITTGDNNICIGNSAEPSAATGVSQIAIGEDVVCTGDSAITVGHAANTATLELDGSDTGWAAASSDERFKENITTSTAGLSFINDLRPITYNWKKKKDVPSDTIYYEEASDEPCLGYSYGNTLHGFIAQEVKTAIDNHSEIKEGFKMWRQYDNGVQTIAEGNLIPILTKAVQELSVKMDTMQTEINNLKQG